MVVAEDDTSVRNALERLLQLEGYEVVVVKDGVAALDTILQISPDIAVVDVMMPFSDGLSVCRELRHR
ncbi:MAG: response regulator, partial [Actinobacteria bacterium]|nr:response regulator [Actinomycetota bacterium]